MELEMLRTVFLKHSLQETPIKSKIQLKTLVEQKVDSLLSVLKRNLLIECLLAVLFNAFPVYNLLRSDGRFVQLFCLLLIALSITFLFQSGRLYIQVGRYGHGNQPLRSSLLQLIGIFNSYTRSYFITTMVVIPVLFVSGLLMSYLENTMMDPLIYDIDWNKSLIIYAGCFVAWMVTMYFFTRWYVHQIYGKHVARLKKTLSELDAQ